jgi:hypothetical protein
MTGDFYRSVQYPNVDRANGGSLQGLIDGLGAVQSGIAGPNTRRDHSRARSDRRSRPRWSRIVDNRASWFARSRRPVSCSWGKSEDEVVAAQRFTADSRFENSGSRD